MSNKKRKAFTLTELLIVVVIIGVLSAVVLPKFTKIIEARRTTEAEELMAAVRNEQEARCSISKDYTQISKLGVYKNTTPSKNFTYTNNDEGVGMIAKAANKKYQLEMPSYVDGRICCSDVEAGGCAALNKNYPSCADLTDKEKTPDFVPGNAECEAEPIPVPTCTEGATQGSQPCNGCGTQTTQVCQGGEWIDQLGACDKTEEECQTNTNRRLCGGYTEQNPTGEGEDVDEAWMGWLCGGVRAVPVTNRDIPIPDNATDEEIEALCCKESCPEGEWADAGGVCCPIGQVSDDNGVCQDCNPAANEIYNAQTRSCEPRFKPTLHNGFGIIEENCVVLGPYFQVAGPQCGRTVVGATTGTPACPWGDGGDADPHFCDSCDANQAECNKACYVRSSKEKACQLFTTAPRIVGFPDELASQTKDNCRATLDSNRVKLPGQNDNREGLKWAKFKYKVDGWVGGYGGDVKEYYSRSSEYGLMTRKMISVCNGSPSEKSCEGSGIDPMVGWAQWQQDLYALMLAEMEQYQEEEAEQKQQQQQQQGQQNQQNQQGQQNQQQSQQQQQHTWSYYVNTNNPYANDPNWSANVAIRWQNANGDWLLSTSNSSGSWTTTNEKGDIVNEMPNNDTVVAPVPTENHPAVQALYDKLKPGEYGWGYTDSGQIYMVQRAGENLAGSTFEYKITYYSSMEGFNNAQWNGKMVYNPDNKTVTVYHADESGITGKDTYKTTIKTWPPVIIKNLNEGNNLGTLTLGPKAQMDQLKPLSLSSNTNTGLNVTNINIPTNSNRNNVSSSSDPGPGSGSYWMYNMWNQNMIYTSEVGPSEGVVSPESVLKQPFCYRCDSDSIVRSVTGKWEYLDERDNPIWECGDTNGWGVDLCLSPHAEEVIGYVCTPY